MDKKYDFHKVEQELEQMWEENKIYKYQNSGEKRFFLSTHHRQRSVENFILVMFFLIHRLK